ncbi:hypothetical protein FPRO05_03349 [Fusarium proliferatum]|uniref:GOLD domain-containing protein n=1 Tax=Gibberella intermedia TaxID=948311 RepID=A0A365MTN3_GIBIN|nr:hypothetical protein FPRO05_03349 [Fusarium proliferatum]
MVASAIFAWDGNLERAELSARDSARSPLAQSRSLNVAASRGPTSKPEPKGEPITTTSSIGLCHIIRSFFVPINDAFLQVPTYQRPVQFLKDISAVAVAIMKFLLPLLSLSAAANALHFFIDGTTPRCFYEELPKDTLVVGHYTAEDSGRTSWLSSKNPNGGIKLTLDLVIGETNQIESSDKGKIQDITSRVKDLNARLADIRREQVFQREREAEFRDQSESTNARVIRWIIIQLIVLGITCTWQLSHLRSFFIKQKLT